MLRPLPVRGCGVHARPGVHGVCVGAATSEGADLMGEYAAILTWTSIGAFVALLLVLFHVRVAPRRRPPAEPADSIDIVATLARFQLHAALFLSLAFLVLILAAWSAGARVLGRSGLGVAALATAPLLVGFAHLRVRRMELVPGRGVPVEAPSEDQAASPEDPA
jgi:hypothetical protein